MHRIFVRKKESLKNLFNYLYKDSTIFIERKFLKFEKFNNNVNTVLN
jgi:hypothetical protein